ncbi:TauT family ABC transporter ATPase [Oleiphilus messinensis]|uniref:TauT family ABC transporter ATPase n=1 Tax=Oleiphilus messinensis TaxID=141451 RepID=A0A1Y0IAD4_9GAMM|nr:ABC transporter ATP-binding protein [Oleiphilus messinensis]ARU56435.1 TauT family ABC transporter ATPase [Oleiphilus messinensis]
MKPYVSFNHIGQTYRLANGQSMTALRDVNFEIQRHEFVAVVGPSGCGKSTLLRLLSGLLIPTEGQVEIFGKPVTEPQDEVGIVFQKPTLLPWLSILDNVVFPLRHKRGSVTPKDRERGELLLKKVGLESFLNRKPDELSGGMQQRVGIARALLLSPDILIMDEPFSALDALTREEMGFELLKICGEQKKTTLFITHSISEAVLLADRVLVMSPRPGTLVDDIPINLAKPRDISTIHSPDFAAYTKRIRDHICNPNVLPEAV